MTRASTPRLVVVGAGSAGASIAALGSASQPVLLLEAGPDYAPEAALPDELERGGRNALVHHDWGYRHRRSPKRTMQRMPRGRVVGGSSAVNTCIALRGAPYDYDEWGLADWTYESCLPAFRALERDVDFGDAPLHGADGPIPIRRHPTEELVPWQLGFLDACAQHDVPRADDANDPSQTGAGPTPMNKIEGRRVSAAAGYLTAEVRARDNFTLRADTHVRRVVFERRRVVGIEVESHGAVETIAADRVFLCAGALATPGILLRSGVGPKQELARLGVELVADVPGVGAQLLDHPGTAIFFRPRPGGLVRGAPLIQTLMRYATERTNDMQLQPGSVVPLPRFDLPLMSLMCSVGKPRSRGTIHFPSADPHQKPVVESNLFDDPADLALAVDGILRLRALFADSDLARLGRHFLPREKTFADRAAVARWIRFACDSGYHPSGTARMGPDSDPGAVTDPRGRVRGVKGLFVADASLFPTIPSCNINIPTLMLGHRFGVWLRDGAFEV
ncbi:MAG: GMC family oxidoreductase N-terminal domain-containing protein [Deltaproteobacteria bacterium]